jgi:hypothetical protein
MREVRDEDILSDSWRYCRDTYAFSLKKISNYDIFVMVTYSYIKRPFVQ